jgi:hypothetical protein
MCRYVGCCVDGYGRDEYRESIVITIAFIILLGLINSKLDIFERYLSEDGWSRRHLQFFTHLFN